MNWKIRLPRTSRFASAGILHPSALEIALGLRPRAISRASGCKIPALGKSLGPRGVYFPIHPSSRQCTDTFFHHYQGSIDFNTVNIHRTVGMYFLVSTGNRGDIEWHDLQRSYYPIHSLLPGVYVSILSLGTVFPRTLPMANIRNTSSRGKHWQCSSNDADKLNVDICRQAKRHYIGCTI